MAGSIFMLLDDIAILADDIAIAAKVGTKKAAAILADDIAVGAKKSTGFSESRELAIIYEIAKGSFINKFILIPIVFLFNFIYPPIIIFSLILGAFYLAFEGLEGFKHLFEKQDSLNEKEITEKEKIKGAIKTDFILSLEIIIIALTAIESTDFIVQLAGTTFVAMLATVGVYGLVALIVRLDDFGFFLKNKRFHTLGDFCINLLPKVIRTLSIVGIFAMLLVAGGIFNHNISFLHNDFNNYTFLYDLFLGLIIGYFIHINLKFFKKINSKRN